MAVNHVETSNGVDYSNPLCQRCGTPVIDHYSMERQFIGCPDVAVGEAIGAAGGRQTPTNQGRRVAQGAVEIPGAPSVRAARPVSIRRAVTTGAPRNQVVYVVANNRKKWDKKAIEASEEMTPREKQMFAYVVSQAKSKAGGAIQSESTKALAHLGFSEKATESALYQLKAKGLIVPKPVSAE